MNWERLNADRCCRAVGNAGGHAGPRLSAVALALVIALGGLAGAALPGAAQAQTAQAQQQYAIPAGTLREALDVLASQSGITVMYSPELVTGKTTRGLSGRFTSTEALRRLLLGSGLEAQDAGDSTFTLKRVSAPTQKPQTGTSKANTALESETQELQQVTVTGTRIRGVQPSSPVVMISQDDMRLAGQNNLGDVIRALPQNFSGGQNPGVLRGSGGSVADQNITGGSSLNLRGLGPDATLTLLNGTRLPYDGFSQATDVMVIPVAAIDRMDVLLDGASAIYGSDAVGGVANIVLKRDYDGAEITARTGGATDGGYNQTQVSLVAGNTWTSGGLLVAAETDSSGAVRASQRDYLRYIRQPEQLMISPKTSQKGVLISGHQNLGSRAELTLDAFLTRRAMNTQALLVEPYMSEYASQVDIYGVSPSLRVKLAHDWTLRVHGFKGEDETRTNSPTFLTTTGAQYSRSRTMWRNQATSADVDLEGPLFTLSGGDARAAFGSGWREVGFEDKNLITGIKTTPYVSNTDRYAYGEISLPVTRKLSFNGALRYDDYDRYGDTTNPKIGMIWNVTPSLDVRANWGKSFKAPTLINQYGSSVVLLPTAMLGIANVPGDATALYAIGGNPGLTPERANITTAGIVFHPPVLPGASVELGWFDIDFTQRVVRPFNFSSYAQFGSGLTDPAYAEFITKNPDVAQQSTLIDSVDEFDNYTGAAYDPSKVVAIFDGRYVNAASQTVRGLDLDLRYTTPLLDGSLNLAANGSWITDAKRKISDLAPEIATAGVVAFPPRFKGRLNATWSRSSFSLNTAINYLGRVTNTFHTPSPRGASMTTVDLIVDYAAEVGQLKGFGFNVSMLNVFNRRPPYLDPSQPYYVNYDSTNYSPLGRIINAAITKRF